MKYLRIAAVTLLVALAAVGAFAQTSETGSISGKVVDASGAALPGVTVEARSASLQGVRSETTDRGGNFRFSLLPPGNYNLTATLSGFNTVRQPNIRVGLNRTVSLDVTMSMAAAETIEVVGAAPVVDVSSNASGANITSETMQTLPFARNFVAAAQVAPGTSTDATGTTVYGSTGAENNYIIDGLNTTEVERGRQGKRLNTEFVQEVEVITGGLNAEYGRMTGGIINAITKSGSNEFHGDVFGYNRGGGLISDNDTASRRPATSTTINETDKELDYGANLGGYILKDRLWFFGAYDRVQEDTLARRINSILVIPGGTNIPVGGTQPTDTTRDLYAGKLSFAITPSHMLNASLFADPSEAEGVLPGLVLAGPPSTYIGSNKRGGQDGILRYSGIFGTNWTVNGSIGQHKEKSEIAGPGKGIGQVIDQTVVPNFRTGGYGFIQDQKFKRDAAKLDIAAFLGGHQIKFGADRENLKAENATQFTGGDRVRKRCLDSVTATSPCAAGRIYYTHEGYTATTVNRSNPASFSSAIIPALIAAPKTENDSFYVQDSWRALSNLTLNLGVRWERQRLGDRFGETVIDLDDNIAPRLGIIYDVLNNGRSKLYANFGRFYEAIPMDINLRTFGGEVSLQANNFSPTPGNFLPDPAAPKFASGNPYSFLGGSGATPIDPDLKGQYVDEFLLGYDQELFTNFAVGIKGTYRNLGRIIEDMLVIEEGEYFIANPGSGIGSTAGFLSEDEAPAPKAKRKFTGVELHAQKRFSNNYQMFASYLWSRLEGNYDGTFQVSTGQLDPNINSAYDYADFAINNDGLLSNDRTHQFKLYGSYTVASGITKGLELGGSFRWESGTPLTGQGYEFAGYRNYEYYLTKRGSIGRGPSDYEADLHVGFPFSVGSGAKITLIADVFNAFDRQSITSLDQRMDLSSDARCAVFVHDFGSQASSVCNGFGGWANIHGTNNPVASFKDVRGSATNPDFLKKGTDFTPPRSIRIGARISF